MHDTRDTKLGDRLRRAFASQTCLTREAIHQLAVGDMNAAEASVLGEHLESCSACSAELELARLFEAPAETAEKRDVDYIVARLRQSAEGRDTESVSRVSHPGGAVTQMPNRAPRIVRLWHLAAAATLVLVVGATARTVNLTAPALRAPTEQGIVRGSAIEPVFPVGELDAMPERLSWEPVEEASSFGVRLTRVDGSVMWEARVDGNAAVIPAEVGLRFHAAVVYTWSVEALDEEDARVAWSGPIEWRVRPGDDDTELSALND